MLKFDEMNSTALPKYLVCFLCSEIARCRSISQKLSLSKRRKVKYTYHIPAYIF